MNIQIGIFDEHRLVMEGISALLSQVSDVDVVFKCYDKTKLSETLKTNTTNILIINIHELSTAIINLISQLSLSNSKTKILVFSISNSEEMILKIIKAGAKGYLTKEADKNELIEAIYTLRNGYDYFSKSITHLLINKYITRIKSKEEPQKTDVEKSECPPS